MEAIGAAVATIAQVSATASQGGGVGGGGGWGCYVTSMEITFDATKIKLVVFQLKGESQIW